MSYIEIPGGIANFRQAVISFWYRAPQSSIDKAYDSWKGEPGVPLDGVVPLVVMGKRGKTDTDVTVKPQDHKETTYVVSYTGVASYGHNERFSEILAIYTAFVGRVRNTFHYSVGASLGQYTQTSEDWVASYSLGDPPSSTDPTYIGVFNDRLYIHFETAKAPDIKNYFLITSSITAAHENSTGGSLYSGPIPTSSFPANAAYPIGSVIEEYDFLFSPFLIFDNYVLIENSGNYEYFPDYTPTGEKPRYHYKDISNEVYTATGVIVSEEIKVNGNHWHHVLISIDMKPIKTHGIASRYETPASEGAYVDSAARLFVAVDDKNYEKYELSSNWPFEYSDPNGVVTDAALDITNSGGFTDQNEEPYPTPTYSLDAPVSAEKGLGIPATGEFVDNIYHTEFAEFQMWVGATLDTGKESNRRAFIDYKRDQGDNPIETEKGMQPVNPAVAEKLMGRKPDITLHGSGKWIKGTNTGSGPNFTPTGEIKRYKPDPSLTGPQGEPQ